MPTTGNGGNSTGFGGAAVGLGIAPGADYQQYQIGGQNFNGGQGWITQGYGNAQNNAFGQMGTYAQMGANAFNDPRLAHAYDAAANGMIAAPQYQPGVAHQVFQQGVDQSIAAQAAMAHSGNPNQSGLAAYNAAQKGAQIQQNAVQQGAMADIQMRQQYDQMAMQAAQQNRAQNLQLLGLAQQGAASQAGYMGQMAGMQGQLGEWYGGQQMDAAQMNMMGQQAYQQLASQNYNTAMGMNAGAESQAAAAGGKLFGGIVGGASDMLSGIGSDERMKTSVASASSGTLSEGTKARYTAGKPDLAAVMGAPRIVSDEDEKSVRPGGVTDADRFLATLHPYTYRYRNPANEPTASPTGGHYLGVMAQDVERSPTGNTIVRDTPRGKVLEGGASLGAAMAGLGRLHERLAALEMQKSTGDK